MAPQEFKLRALLSGHTSDVRGVLHPDPSFAVTASRDGSTRIWKQTSASPPAYDPDESSHGGQFKTCLAYAPPSKEYPDGLVVSSGQDALIEARQPATTAEANADGFMVGHHGQVCTLDVGGEGRWIVSGSWDGTARIWEVGKWEAEVELAGHQGTVWAVVAYDRDTTITGCADRGIRVYDLRGKLKNQFDGKDVVRALAKLPEGHKTGAQLASASNDGCVRLWTLEGNLVQELWGHESFIYSLAVLPSGEIVSSGEDRSVRVWHGAECVQVITLPAISVWSVAACPNGDLIIGSSDKMARIFTREPSRLADEATLKLFTEEVQQSAIPKAQVGSIDVSELKDYEWLKGRSGTKEGQQQIVKKHGQPTLYQWSQQQQTWTEVGQVVDGAGSSSKAQHNGKEYDYVFDIDIEDGKPPLKLPYNVIQNPYEAATKFLQDHELPISYLEETANFIIKNTGGATLGEQSGPASSGPDPWGTDSRYRPGQAPSSSYQPRVAPPTSLLPQKQYLSIVLGKPTAAAEQIVKRNAEYGDTDMALSKSELEVLTNTAQLLSKYNFQDQPSLATPAGLESTLPSLIKAATQWQPPANRLAVLDILRFLSASLKTFLTADSDGVDVVAAILGSGIFDSDSIDANSKLVMMAMRLFSNLLYGSGKSLIDGHIDAIIESLKPAATLAQTDNNAAIAYTTCCLNLAVFVTTCKSDPDMNAHHGLTLVEALAKLLATFPAVNHAAGASAAQQSTEPAYRGLVALGTILVGMGREDVKQASKEIFEVPKVLQGLREKKYLEEPRFRGVVREIQGALS